MAENAKVVSPMSISAVVKSMRPVQWTKNLFVFAALIFSQKFFEMGLLAETTAAFLIFCFLSGAQYIFNDIWDINEDKSHPEKSERPIASGELSRTAGIILFILLSASCLVTASFLSFYFFLAALTYFLLQMAYTVRLKHVVILDVFIIAAGFVIRVIAGGLVIQVPISSWLLVCTTLLALFIGMSKRRHELVLLNDKASDHRPILKEYSAYLLDQMIAVVTASTLIAYCLYTISEETVEKFGTTHLVYTSAFVLYGIFRYLYLVHQKGKGGSPEEIIIQDKPLLINILLWVGSAIAIIYLF